jgi:hypothetical protein
MHGLCQASLLTAAYRRGALLDGGLRRFNDLHGGVDCAAVSKRMTGQIQQNSSELSGPMQHLSHVAYSLHIDSDFL